MATATTVCLLATGHCMLGLHAATVCEQRSNIMQRILTAIGWKYCKCDSH